MIDRYDRAYMDMAEHKFPVQEGEKRGFSL